MTRLRLARLAGELVALGIYFIPAAVTLAGLFGQAVCFLSIRDLTRPGRPEKLPARSLDRYWLLEDRLSETERKVELHTADIAVIDYDLFAEFALTLGAFALQQVTTTCLRTNNLTGSGNFEPLGHGLLGFAAGDGFWHGAWTITE
jgi:hypothetical protein